jgi:hypothetical protein
MAEPSGASQSANAPASPYPLVHIGGGGFVPELGMALGQGTFLAEVLPDGAWRLYQPPEPVAEPVLPSADTLLTPTSQAATSPADPPSHQTDAAAVPAAEEE